MYENQSRDDTVYKVLIFGRIGAMILALLNFAYAVWRERQPIENENPDPEEMGGGG